MIRNIIFDLGDVIIKKDLNYIINKFTKKENEVEYILEKMLNSPEHELLDLGKITIEEAVNRINKRNDYKYEKLTNDYAKESFNDDAQIRLKHFCDRLQSINVPFMLSNSDCLGRDGSDRFFDDLFEDYDINRVWASRSVNADGSKRGKLTEILVRNYTDKQQKNIIYRQVEKQLSLRL